MPAKLSHRLILNEWIFTKFGYSSAQEGMSELSNILQKTPTGCDEQNVFYFSHALKLHLPENRNITDDLLQIYDSNIYQHWYRITKERFIIEHREIFPLYFQYLSLLFTEYYLDRLTEDLQVNSLTLLDELNTFRLRFNNRFAHNADRIPEFSQLDLRKLAFWIATGGGKTLIMHCNIKQFEHYIYSRNLNRLFNKYILITPNEGLTQQHLKEFNLSGISAISYSKDSANELRGLFVEVIEITKLRDTTGVTTVAVSEFGKNNLVMVDEGHRGSGGDEWFSKRQQLCEEGFSFEYSATFGQAVNALSGIKKTEMSELYAKSVLFDYSYKYFYNDGYGKDYFILNYEGNESEIHQDQMQQLYLTACLLKFYQQCLLLKDNHSKYSLYLLEDPLMIFVGGTVTSSREQERDTDIITVLRYFARFISNRDESLKHIRLLLENRDDFRNEDGYVFRNSFSYLGFKYPIISPIAEEQLFNDLLNVVFNAPGGGLLHAVYLKGSGNEVGLKIGDSSEYFGVINIGEPRTLWKMLNQLDDDTIICTEQNIAFSLFEDINKDGSEVRVLIGAKKFTEGWNCWRVSSMGLINVGKQEGAQIIQLFGRGVRLKGLDFSLKRSSYLKDSDHPAFIEECETLNVFGVRANYMQEFKAYLEEEEVPKETNEEIIMLPTILNLANSELKVILPKKDMPKFKQKKVVQFGLCKKIRGRIQSDWYSRLQSISNRFRLKSTDEGILHKDWLTAKHLYYLNINNIYLQLLNHKRKFAYYNLEITIESIIELLHNKDWYELFVPEHLLKFDDFKKVMLWEEIALSILKAYCDKFYQFQKSKFEEPFREYRTLKDVLDHPEENVEFIRNLKVEYKAAINKSRTTLIENLRTISSDLRNKNLPGELNLRELEIFNFDKHLYNPLIYVSKDNMEIRISPTKLNNHEKKFIQDIKVWCQQEKDKFLTNKELYILRNQEKGKGVSFFDESRFNPDFIIWLVIADKQFITFADPHGLIHARSFEDGKILLSQTIKDIEKELGDENVVLNSYIISPTRFRDISFWKSGADLNTFAEYNVLFMYDDELYVERMFGNLNTC